MKISNIERSYCINLTDRQFRRILDRDERSLEKYDIVSGRYSYPQTLTSRVCGIPGVREIAYDHWLMPAIYVRVEEPFEEVLEKVKKEIAKYAH